MAQAPLIVVKGSTIKVKAKGGTNTEIEIDCINEDFEIDWGSKATEKSKCHKEGVYYDRATNLEFGETTMSIKGLPSDKADTLAKFIFDSLYETTGTDFDLTTATGKIEYTIAIVFVDPNTNNVTLEGYTTNIKSVFVVDKSLTFKWGFQAVKKPVRA